MALDNLPQKTKGRDVYARYRETLRMPKLTVKEINEIRANLQAVARAVCEYVWGKDFH
jgi:hypothetical protein